MSRWLTTSGDALLVIARSAVSLGADVDTVTVAVSPLLPGTGSFVEDVTEAAFTSAPSLLACTTTFADAMPLAGTDPSAQVSVPGLDTTQSKLDTKSSPGGSMSVTTTLSAVSGPLFATASTKVSCSPTTSDASVGDFVRARSALAGSAETVTLAVALLLPAVGSAVDDVTEALFWSVPSALASAVSVIDS